MSSKVQVEAVRKNSQDEIKRLIASKYPIIWIESWEEDRVEGVLQKVAKSAFSQGLDYLSWTQTDGLSNGEKVDVIDAIQTFLKNEKSGILLIKDFSWDLASEPLLRRMLRDVFHLTKGTFKTLFLLSPKANVPEDMLKEILTITFDLPSEGDMKTIFDSVIKIFPKTKDCLSNEQKGRLMKAALGLTGDEAKFIFQKMMVGNTELNESSLDLLFEEKARIIRRDGLLEFVQTKYKLEDIGGLENLKEWVVNRSSFFSEEAKSAGVQMPKGLLMTGVSGCGKSLCSQVIAAAWGLPLYRLDMNRIFGGALGNAEESFRRAIIQVESVAPAIMWLEEIEKGVAGYEQGDKGVTARIFSSFLTWMQEHTTPVFVAATANEISRLPPELLRKGRFDEIFFVDLPSEKERERIFDVHLKRKGIVGESFNLTELAKATGNFSGAEIEQCVLSALVYAFNEKRKITQGDLFRAATNTVPLATTMSEQIKIIKRWADTRAVKASRG